MGPRDVGTAYRPYNDANRAEQRAHQQQTMEEADLLDVNAAIHGNWNIENAKAKLHQYMQMNKINTEYRYQSIGPDHSRYSNSGPCVGVRVSVCVCVAV